MMKLNKGVKVATQLVIRMCLEPRILCSIYWYLHLHWWTKKKKKNNKSKECLHFYFVSHLFFIVCIFLEYAMANVVCEYANESPTRPTSAAAGSIQDEHPDYPGGRSMSPAAKRFASDSNFYSGISEPGRRIRRSESLLRQAADSVSKGQTFQTVSDMFQIPISTIR